MKNVFLNLLNFKGKSKLKNAFWMYLVNNMAKDSEKKIPADSFKELNKKGDGQLTKEELNEGYEAIFGKSLSEEQLSAIFLRVDFNHKGYITYNGKWICSFQNFSLLLFLRRI